jgi:hypothetical protein
LGQLAQLALLALLDEKNYHKNSGSWKIFFFFLPLITLTAKHSQVC